MTETAVQLTHRLVVISVPEDPDAFIDILRERLSLHPTDARIQARSAPGILPAFVSPDEGGAVVEDLAALGCRAKCLPSMDVPSLHPIRPIHHVRWEESGLIVLDSSDQPESVILWRDLELVSVGRVPVGEAVRAEPTPEPGPQVETSGLQAWLVLSSDRAFRITHNAMNYSFLGDALTPSAHENFRKLLQKIVESAPTAYLTPAARSFVHGEPVLRYSFRTPDELRRYTAFHLLLAREIRNQEGS